MADQKVQIVISALDRASGTVRKVGNELDGLDRRAGRMGGGVGSRLAGARAGIGAGIGAGASVGGALMGAAGLGAIGAGFGAAKFVSAAADYESALTGIQKKSGMTADEVARLGEEAKALATSGKVAIPLDEMLAGIERGVAAGIPKDEIMDFITLTAKASDAFEMTAEDVATAGETIGQAFAIPRDEMQEMFDVINTLSDAGIAAESDVVNFLTRSGANLKMFGMAREEAAALGTTLLNIGMPAEVASRAMNTLTTQLMAPGSPKARKSLQGIVGDLDDFQELIRKDATGAMDLFLTRVNELDKFKAAELLNGFLGAGFSDEVLRLAAATDELGKNMDIAHNRSRWIGSLDAAYNLKLDDFWSQWAVFENQLAVLSIDIGGAVMPSVVDGMNNLKNLAIELQAGLDQLKIDLDWQEIDRAKSAAGELLSQVQLLMGVDPSKSGVTEMFKDISNTINTISSGINDTKEFIDWMDEQSGEKARREQRQTDEATLAEQQALGLAPEDRDFGILGNIREGGVADKIFDAIDAFGANFGRPIRTDWGAPGLPALPEGATVETIGSVPTHPEYEKQSDRINPSMYSPTPSAQQSPELSITTPTRFIADAVPPQPMQSDNINPSMYSPTPTAMQASDLTYTPPSSINVAALQAEAEQARAIIDGLSFLKANPTLGLETTQFFALAQQAQAMLTGLERTVTARADLDIGLILAKVAQAREAISSLESGGGNSHGSNVRSQFAPVGSG